MKNHKLFVRIFTPGVQNVEELLTVDFLTINNCTSFRCDVEVRISTILTLLCKISVSHEVHKLTTGLHTDQDLFHLNIIHGGDEMFTINITTDQLRVLVNVELLNMNFRRCNETTINQFRSRDSTNNVTINLTIVHTWFVHSHRSLTGSSEEVTTIRVIREELCRTKEITLNTVVCFIKVNWVHFDVSILNTLKRMISGEDNHTFTNRTCDVNELVNLLWFSRTEVTSFTTMNMHHMNIRTLDHLTELRTKLFSQQNSWTHNNNRGGFFLHLTLCIHDGNQSLTTTSWDNNLTFVVVIKCIQSTLLMRTESDHDVVIQ